MSLLCQTIYNTWICKQLHFYGNLKFSQDGERYVQNGFSSTLYSRTFSRKTMFRNSQDLIWDCSRNFKVGLHTFPFARLWSTSCLLGLLAFVFQGWRDFRGRISTMAQLDDLLGCSKYRREVSALTPQKVGSTDKAASVCVRPASGKFFSRPYCFY